MHLLLSSVLVLAAVAGVAWGDVKGSLEVGGEKIQLTKAYALQYDNEEKLIDAPELRILLVDREIDPALLSPATPVQLTMMAMEGKLRGVLLCSIKSDDGYAIQGTVYYRPKDPRQSMIFFTHSGTDPVFKRLDVKDGQVSGEVEEASQPDSDSDDTAYKFDLTFSAPVMQRDPVTAHFKGADAVSSAPAKALMEYDKACRAGDLDAARKLATEARMRDIEDAINQMGKDGFIKEAAQWIPDPAKLQKQIVEVIVRGKRAVVILDDDGSRNGSDMIQDGDVWKAE